jgi:hypothetical protein
MEAKWHLPAFGVELNLRQKTLDLHFVDPSSGLERSRVEHFPLVRATVCAVCNSPVSIWAEGKPPAFKNVRPHTGPWRIEGAGDCFVLLAKDGHNFHRGCGDTPQCIETKTTLVFGPDLAIRLESKDDSVEGWD